MLNFPTLLVPTDKIICHPSSTSPTPIAMSLHPIQTDLPCSRVVHTSQNRWAACPQCTPFSSVPTDPINQHHFPPHPAPPLMCPSTQLRCRHPAQPKAMPAARNLCRPLPLNLLHYFSALSLLPVPSSLFSLPWPSP